MPCAAAHSVVRSFRNILPPLSPSSLSLCLSLLAIQQVDHRAYAAPSTVGPTQLPRVTRSRLGEGGCYAINPWPPVGLLRGTASSLPSYSRRKGGTSR